MHRAVATVLLSIWAASPGATAAADKPRPAALVLAQAPPALAPLLVQVEQQLTHSRHYRLVLLPALTPLMKQADDAKQIAPRATSLMEQGRQAMVALNQAQASAKLTEARDLLQSSFMPFYAPRLLAQVQLLLGVIYLEQKARPDLARQAFIQAHQLTPGLVLDAHYSPRVRSAFQQAARSLPPAPPPEATALERLADLAQARVALVLSARDTGEQSMLQGALFLRAKGAYTEVESRLVDRTSAVRMKRQTADLGRRLRLALEAHYPAPRLRPLSSSLPASRPASRPTLPPPPPPRPWYKRWYTWTAVGVVAATLAITLPLTLRTETSDLVVHW